MMFLGKYKIDEINVNNIYYDWNQWHAETFRPQTKNIDLLALKVTGKTYQERKASARDLAVMYQLQWSALPWSWGEIAEIGAYFEKIGKRYGLIEEYHENGII